MLCDGRAVMKPCVDLGPEESQAGSVAASWRDLPLSLVDRAFTFTVAIIRSRDSNSLKRHCIMGLKKAEWHKLPVSLTELCINTTLRCGQSFR
jgi:hypothetical protein